MKPEASRITQVEISSIPRPKPRGLFDPKPIVTATFDDGTTKVLFEFYPDEIGFCPDGVRRPYRDSGARLTPKERRALPSHLSNRSPAQAPSDISFRGAAGRHRRPARDR